MSMLRSITSRITGMSFHRPPVQNHNVLESKPDTLKEISQKLGHLFLKERLTPEDSKTLLEYISKALSPHSNAAEIDSLISEFNNKKAFSPDFLKEYFQEIQESKTSLFAATSKISIPKNIQKLMTLLWLYSKDQTLRSSEYDHKEFGFEKFKEEITSKNISDGLENNIFNETVLEFILFKIQNDPEYTIPGISIYTKIFKDKTQHCIDAMLILAIRYCNINIIKLALIYEMVDINKINKHGHTPLIVAIMLKDRAEPVIRLLLQKSGIDVNQADRQGDKDDKGNTPLHWAIGEHEWYMGRGLEVGAAKLLFEHDQIDVEKTTARGNVTPLYLAVSQGRIDLAKLLLATGKIFHIQHTLDYLNYRKIMGEITATEREFLNSLEQYDTLLRKLLYSKEPSLQDRENMVEFINKLRKEFLLDALEAKHIVPVFLKTTLQGRAIKAILQHRIKKEDGSLYTFYDIKMILKHLPHDELLNIQNQLSPKIKINNKNKFTKFFGNLYRE